MSLRQKLSHLTRTQALKILGRNGASLLQQGGVQSIAWENIEQTEHLLRLRLPEATVTLVEDPHAPERIRSICSCGASACKHLGTLLSLILEEKSTLNLVAEVQHPHKAEITDAELEQWEYHLRAERAGTEPLMLEALQPKKLWSDYLVSNANSGRTYRVALRGWQAGENYCSCPDFRKNTLGTCKHILFAIAQVRQKFPRWQRADPFQTICPIVFLSYGKALRLQVRLPLGASPLLRRHLAKFVQNGVEHPLDLLRALSKLIAAGENVLVYPDAQAYLDRIAHQEQLANLVAEIRKDPIAHPLRKTLLQVELLPYQLEGIAFAAGQGRAILADDMGLGKTIQGVGLAELLAREENISRVLVVTPASVKGQWANEIQKFCQRSVHIVGSYSGKQVESPYQSGAFFTLCNYEQVLRDLRHLENQTWDLIILDEGQRIKNWEAKTSRAVKVLRSRFALVLSGTPLENRLEELYSVMEFIDDRRLGPDYQFKHRHVISDGPTRKLGYRNLDKLRAMMQPVLLRRTRAMVLKQLPPRTTEIISIPPTAEQLEVHGSYASTISQIVHKKVLTEVDLLRLQKAMLLCRMSADSTTLVDKKEPGYSSKLERLAELLPQLAAEPGRKVIIFSEWTGM
ncbi:MAG TPA: SNF2-related protein, partial [Fibrobacteraceae bacterium]|nr:SNF2-related protein [Fibrobacteraceae bacterium]